MAVVYETRWNGIHAWRRQASRFMHQHAHDYVEMLYARGGEWMCYINFKEYKLNKGDVVFVFPGQIHSHEASEYENIALLFPKNLPVYDAVFCNMLPKTPVIRGIDEKTDALFCEAAKANDKRIMYSKGITQGYISLILGTLLPKLELYALSKSEATTEEKLIKYCSAHYSEHITLNSVAEALGYSPTHLSHLFADKFKTGFSKLISTMRIEDAKKMLRGKKSITQIALDCGFGSMRNFNRVFKEATGKTPSEYRKEI
ncbi:MAG: AraC family transcriptional regulator [Clostridia bacterium]|nr:AraC family transcriptional regulator [Clostridia bacterium]